MKLKNLKTGMILFFFLMLTMPQVKAQNISEALDPFKELKTFSGVEVRLIPGNEYKIEISGHSKDKVKYDIVEGRLEVRLSLDNLWSEDDTEITVYSKDLLTIDANEGSVVEVQGTLKGDLLAFRAQEGAVVLSGAEADQVAVKAISGGRIELKGQATQANVEVNTGGQFLGRQLKTKHAEIKANTAGKAEAYASEYAKATAKIGGVIEIFGNPKELDTKTSLGGKIL